MKESDYQEILQTLEKQINELAYLEENEFDKFTRTYAQDLDHLENNYSNKKRSKKTTLLVAIICLLFIIMPITYYFREIIFYTEVKKEQLLAANNDIAYLEDVQKDYDLAINIQYVITEYNQLPYDKVNRGVIVYNNKGLKELIYVNRIIDANNNYRVIADCYQKNVDINKTLNNCLVKDKKYVVSRVDKAIIEEDNFFDHYYDIKKQEI